MSAISKMTTVLSSARKWFARNAAKILVEAALCLFALHSWAAELVVDVKATRGSCSGAIYLDGELAEGDAERLEWEIVQLHRKFHTDQFPKACYRATLRLHLNSPGGSVEEAISMGRVARKFELVTYAHRCASSCVFVFAGGVQRFVLGSVEVHHPFFQTLNPELTSNQIGSLRKILMARVSRYIEDMNVSALLVEAMLSTPPEKVRVLSKKELHDLRLVGVDPDFDERETAREAYIYGVNSAALRRGKSLAEVRCRDNPQCRTSAILGISIEQATLVEGAILNRCYPEEHLPENRFVECLRSHYTTALRQYRSGGQSR